jgi:hypothetical protein
MVIALYILGGWRGDCNSTKEKSRSLAPLGITRVLWDAAKKLDPRLRGDDSKQRLPPVKGGGTRDESIFPDGKRKGHR